MYETRQIEIRLRQIRQHGQIKPDRYKINQKSKLTDYVPLLLFSIMLERIEQVSF